MKLSKALARLLQRQVLTEIETLRRSTEGHVSATTSQVFAARSTLSSQIQELSNDLVLIRQAITALGQQIGGASRAFDVQTHRLHDDMVQLAIKQQVADEMHVQANAALTILQEKQIELHQFVEQQTAALSGMVTTSHRVSSEQTKQILDELREVHKLVEQQTAMLSDQVHANHQTALVEIERFRDLVKGSHQYAVERHNAESKHLDRIESAALNTRAEMLKEHEALFSDLGHAHDKLNALLERLPTQDVDDAWAIDLLLGLRNSGSLNMADAAHVAETLNEHGIETGARAPGSGQRRVSDAGDFDDTTRQPVPNARVGWGSLGDLDPIEVRVADEEGV